MEGSGHFSRVADAEGGGALAAAPTPMRSMPPLPPDTPAGPCPHCSRSVDEALAAAAKARDLAFQLQRAEATSAADQRRVASLEGQLRSLEDERRSSTAAGLGSQSDADRYRRKLAEAEGALAAAESRISLLEGSARRDQQQMEGTIDGRTRGRVPRSPPLTVVAPAPLPLTDISRQFGELTAVKSMMEADKEAQKRAMDAVKDDNERLTRQLAEAAAARDAAERNARDLQGQVDRAAAEAAAADLEGVAAAAEERARASEQEAATLREQAAQGAQAAALRKRVADLEAQIKAITAENALSEMEVSSLTQQLALARADANEAQNTSSENGALREALRELTEKQATLVDAAAAADRRAATLESELAAAQAEEQRTRQALADAEAERPAAAASRAALEASLADATAQHARSDEKVRALQHRLQELDEAYQAAVASLESQVTRAPTDPRPPTTPAKPPMLTYPCPHLHPSLPDHDAHGRTRLRGQRRGGVDCGAGGGEGARPPGRRRDRVAAGAVGAGGAVGGRAAQGPDGVGTAGQGDHGGKFPGACLVVLTRRTPPYPHIHVAISRRCMRRRSRRSPV